MFDNYVYFTEKCVQNAVKAAFICFMFDNYVYFTEKCVQNAVKAAFICLCLTTMFTSQRNVYKMLLKQHSFVYV